ncbi:MAG: T9SS type A sorting domain-containing protein [Chitinophagales bacterium]
MKQKLLLFTLLLTAAMNQAFSQVVFQENFQGGIPATFTLRNVDGLTPNTAVAYVNNAWIAREDFANNVADTAAFSTSWYTPAGTSNDWMFTPVINSLPANTILTWNAVAYDASYQDGYEVRIFTGASIPATPNASTGTVVFSTAAEVSTWTSHSVNLNAYAGQNIYIAFRNNSFDKFLLLIDDIKVEVPLNYDAELTSVTPISEYTLTPKTQVIAYPLSGVVSNTGLMSISNVGVTATVYDESFTAVYTASSTPVASLAPAATSNFTMTGFTPSAPGGYMITYNATLTEVDGKLVNNTDTQYLYITNSVYARDNGNPSGSLGIGAGNGGYLGQKFTIVNTATVNAIGIYYGGIPEASVDFRIAGCIWSMVNDTPHAIIALTDTLLRLDTLGGYYVLPIQNNGFSLTPGNYAFTAIEFTETAAVGQTDDLFVPNTTFVKWPTSPLNGWGNNEDFGAGFSKPYIIRPILCAAIQPNLTASDATCGATNGSVTSNPTGWYYALGFTWSNDSTTFEINNLPAGTYTVTMSDFNNCSASASATVNAVNLTLTGTILGSSSTCTASNGGLSLTPTNGTPAYTYSWSNGGNTSNLTGLAAGNYTVTITDAVGCTGTVSGSVTALSVAITSDVTTTQSSCTSNTGSATAAPTNGTSPYTYLWSNGGAADAITNVGPGTYTVTITDANGCTGTKTATVGTPNGPTASSTTTDVSCFGTSTGAIDVTVTGGTGNLTYSWSNSASTQDLSNLAVGTYTVTVSDANSCSFTTTAVVNGPAAALTTSGTSTNATNGNNGAVDLTVAGGTSAYTYNWSNAANTEDVSGLAAGTYTVTVTDSKGCTASSTFTIISVGISGIEYVNQFNVFPNPASAQTNIRIELTESADITVELFAANGQLVSSHAIGNVQNTTYTLNTLSLPGGVYTIRVSGEKFNAVQRLTITK